MEQLPQSPNAQLNQTAAQEAPTLEHEGKNVRNTSVWRKAFSKLGLFREVGVVSAGVAIGAATALGVQNLHEPSAAKQPERAIAVDAVDPGTLPGSEMPGVLAPGAQPPALERSSSTLPELPDSKIHTEFVTPTEGPNEYSLDRDPVETYTIPAEVLTEPILNSDEVTKKYEDPAKYPSMPVEYPVLGAVENGPVDESAVSGVQTIRPETIEHNDLPR